MNEQMAQEFPSTPRAPGAARAFATSALDDLLCHPVPPELCSDLQLVVSELVTNAVRAGSPTVHVSLGVEHSRVVVWVADQADGWPAPRAATDSEPGGRGLPLVGALSATWGVRPTGPGKVVWAKLPVDGG